MKKIIFTGLLLAGLHSLLMAQDSTSVFKKVSSLKEALATAKKEHKMLFVDCYFQGCGPCAQMDREVFPNSTVRPALEKDFIPVKVDVYKNKWGDSIAMQYAVSGFPSLLVLNEDGKVNKQGNRV
jgi:thioredoxin-related protein